ncbi:NAD-dependent epimerase/dehydratase family protein [Sphingobacterium chuzhouense]|uniref:NAD-dependent epimerase/dehydratase family protein n=1 Tax=Sphingobacterium chuzhouense TaxID=1742264 RepID=A0ABR7XU64_9SPHI|nr:NAD-dependent epimerase/dehydratase family protein [Sphingobacterium chuzhouense]MBD1422507.1 NAD-dependent epimerase/dehydratase family protein [Sphingobacterium chuzhouense]
MKIILIGGSGFVGTRLIDKLLEIPHIEVLNIDKNNSEKYPELTRIGNVMDWQTLAHHSKGSDVVVLLAAEHRDDVSPVSLYYDINVEGMRNTLKAMDANGIKRLIFTSSVAVYGLDRDNPNESAPIDPFNDYGKSKWQAEQVLHVWHRSHLDWDINIIRPTVIFGEGNRGNVYNLLKQIASGRFLMIGRGRNKKSMSYIGNIVAFIWFLIEQEKTGYEVYNYVDKPDFTTNDLVHHTGQIVGKKIPTVRIPYWLGMLGGYGFDVLAFITRKKLNISSVRVKKFCAVTQFSSSKAMASGFVPPYTMEEGLRNMLEEEFGRK